MWHQDSTENTSIIVQGITFRSERAGLTRWGSPSRIEAPQFSIYHRTRCNTATSESPSSDYYYDRVSQTRAEADASRPSKSTGLTSVPFGCGVTRTSPKLVGSVGAGVRVMRSPLTLEALERAECSAVVMCYRSSSSSCVGMLWTSDVLQKKIQRAEQMARSANMVSVMTGFHYVST